MNLPREKVRELDELSLLDPDDPRRRSLVESLSVAEKSVRDYWAMLEREDQLLRESTRGAPVPRDLLEKLLALPERAQPLKKSWKNVSVPWPVAAAIVISMFAGAGYWYWRSDQPPGGIVRLADAPRPVVESIEAIAIDRHETPGPLEVSGSDLQKVAAALQARVGKGMPFPVAIPAPPPDFHLIGGSVVPFGKGVAVYTRWEREGHAYSLFQLAPDTVGMPHEFASMVDRRPAGAHPRYRLTLWPGAPAGVCTWIAVGDVNAPQEPFGGSTY